MAIILPTYHLFSYLPIDAFLLVNFAHRLCFECFVCCVDFWGFSCCGKSLKAMAAPCASLVASHCALANKAQLLPGRVAVASSRSSNREVVRRCAEWRARNCAGMLSSGFVGKRVTRSICFKPSACSKRFIHSTVAKDAPLVVRSFSLECR